MTKRINKRNTNRFKYFWQRVYRHYKLVPHGRLLANYSVDRAKLFQLVEREYKPGSFQWIYLVSLIIGSPLLTATVWNEHYSALKRGEINKHNLKKSGYSLYLLIKLLSTLWNVSLEELPLESNKNLTEIVEEINEKYKNAFPSTKDSSSSSERAPSLTDTSHI